MRHASHTRHGSYFLVSCGVMLCSGGLRDAVQAVLCTAQCRGCNSSTCPAAQGSWMHIIELGFLVLHTGNR